MAFTDDYGNEYEPIVDNYDEDNRDGTILLDCDNCHVTSSGTNWNKSLRNSIRLGVAEQFIPDTITQDEWEEYADEFGGSVDCPCCGEPTLLQNLEPVG